MARLVNRGFTVTLLSLAIFAELALRAAAAAPPGVVRNLYGTTLAMYMAIEERLAATAPDVRVLALGDSLTLTQFQPDVFAADHGLPPRAVFNASYLAQTFRSHENLLGHVGLDRLTHLQRVLIFVNPRRLTADGNQDAAVFRVAIPEQRGTLRQAWEEKRLSPILDRSRLYGLSRYLVSASWRQFGRPASWDSVEYLTPQGGVAYEGLRPGANRPDYLYEPIGDVSEEYVAALQRVIDLFRSRNVSVVLLTNALYPGVSEFADAGPAERFAARMQRLAADTGSAWMPIRGFQPPAESDFLDYGHVNRSGGVAFTRRLRDVLAALPPIE
jgi:hypothetical protein